MGRDKAGQVSVDSIEASLFLTLAVRDGVRLIDFAIGSVGRGATATSVGRRLGIAAEDVRAYCDRWAGFGWYDYRDEDYESGWVTEIGKIAATYLWSGDAAGSN